MANREKLVVDVNALAIFLVEDHPGNSFVAPEMERGLKGDFTPLLLDIAPLRAFWIMTRRWGCDPAGSEKAVRHFLHAYPIVEYCSVERKMVDDAFEMAHELRHDVFDTLYLALAAQYGASGVFTTDTDFQRLCGRKKMRYVNPVPLPVLEKFAGWHQS